MCMSNQALRFSGHKDRGSVKGRGKRGDRDTNNRENKKHGVGESEPKQKWELDRIARGKAIHIQPKNLHQEQFLKSMRENTISIGTGSAGTGKSFLACYYAASELLAGNIRKIIITRPYVAVSNRTTGYKPGEDLDKLRPFVLPLLGYLSEVLGKGMVEEQLLLADKKSSNLVVFLKVLKKEINYLKSVSVLLHTGRTTSLPVYCATNLSSYIDGCAKCGLLLC